MVEEALTSRINQLNQARSLVESDPSYFPQIVVGVLPVFNDAAVELRYWVAEFVASAFTSNYLSASEKENLASKCLDRLTAALAAETNIQVMKSFIQLSSALYPILFRHVYATGRKQDVSLML